MFILWVLNNLRNDTLLKDFGTHVRTLRQEKMFTLQGLADKCEMELSQIHRIEKGQVNATLSTVAVLAKGLETTVGELLKPF